MLGGGGGGAGIGRRSGGGGGGSGGVGSLLGRPRLSALRTYLRPRSAHIAPAAAGAAAADMARHKKAKARKATGFHKMDSSKKRSPDYTDIAYREAVARLRYLLAESYSPQATPTKIPHVRSNKPEDSGDETDASMAVSDRSRPRHHHHVHPPPSPYRSPYFGAKRSLYTDIVPKATQLTSTLQVPKIVDGAGSAVTNSKTDGQQPPPELMAFIERQEDYIEQLEKESQYCREELTNLLSKVKDIISENEGLHEKEKSGILKSVFEYLTSGGEEEEEDDEDEVEEKRDRKKSPTKKKRLEGPSIVFESRISELEAQLTQTKIELRKAQEEAEMLKKKYSGLEPGSVMDSATSPGIESYKKQIDALQREKEELADNLAKLSSAVSHMRDKEADASQKVKRSFDMVDQAQFEKAQAELEVRRLKDELERQHEKLRDLLQEQGRRVQDERTQAERRYAQQVEQLTCDLSAQWDTAGKLQLELEKQRRTESELRRELQQKSAIIEELKKELQTKIAGLQSEATQSAAERGSLEQELAASRLVTERAEREARQESARLQAEITALRQRLDRADADLLHSRRENLRLSEQIASLERELNLAKMMKESSDKPSGEGPSSNTSREKELTSMIMNMEAKHVQTVGELESMIQTQTDLMEKLKDECRSLTQKLEESSARHKEERMTLRVERAVLLKKLEQVWENFKELEQRSLESSVCNVLSASGSPVQTTTMLRAMSEGPSMALRLTSSTNSSPNMRHSPHSNLSPSTSPSPGTRRSSPVHIPSTSKNMHPSPHSSPSLNTASTNKNMLHSPHTSLNPNTSSMSKNTQHNSPHISLNQNTINVSKSLHNSPHTSLNLNTTNMSKNTNSSPQTSPNLNTSHQNSTSHNQTMALNQVTDQIQITVPKQSNNSPVMNSSLNIHHSQTTVDPKPNIKLQSPSINPRPNSPTSKDPQQENSILKLLGPNRPLENSPVQNKFHLLQDDLVLCPDRDLAQINYLLCPRQHLNDSSGKAAPNSLPDLQAELLLHPRNNLVQNYNSPIPQHPTTRHSMESNLHLIPTLNNLEHMTTDSLLSTLQKHSLNLAVNPVQNHTLPLAHQVWNPSGKDLVPTRPLRDHHLPSLKPRCKVDLQPPLTLEDLATDSDSCESQAAQQLAFR